MNVVVEVDIVEMEDIVVQPKVDIVETEVELVVELWDFFVEQGVSANEGEIGNPKYVVSFF